MWPEIREFLGSNILALCLAFLVAALEVKGVIKVAIARLYLMAAWAIATFGAAATLNDAPLRHRLITIAYVGIPAAIILIVLDIWTTRIVRRREAALLRAKTIEEEGEPNIVCGGEDDLFVKLDRHEIFRKSNYYGAGALRADVVKFSNESKPGHKVASVKNVRAQIIFYKSDWPEREDYRVDYACWLDEESPYVSFNLSDNAVHYLIVGVFQTKKDGGNGYEPKYTIYSNSPDRNAPLSTNVIRHPVRYKVRVQLIVGEQGQFSSEYDFELEIEPASESFTFQHLTDEEKQARKADYIRQLKAFIVEGEKFFDKPDGRTEREWGTFYTEAHEWRNKVYAFIRRTQGSLVADRFFDVSRLTSYPHEVHENRRGFLSELYTQFKNLERMAKEYENENEKQPAESEPSAESLKPRRSLALEVLMPLLQEGQQLERVAWDVHDRFHRNHSQYEIWSKQVERTLRLYLGESFVGRFHAQDEEVGDRWPAPDWPAQLKGRVSELERIVRELAD